MAEGGPGASGDVVAALRAVDGVADASITPDRRLGGAGTLHLALVPGADEVAVATAVNRILREHFGLAVDTDNVSVVDETAPVRLTSVPPLPDEPDDSEPAEVALYVPEPDEPDFVEPQIYQPPMPEPEPELPREPEPEPEPEQFAPPIYVPPVYAAPSPAQAYVPSPPGVSDWASGSPLFAPAEESPESSGAGSGDLDAVGDDPQPEPLISTPAPTPASTPAPRPVASKTTSRAAAADEAAPRGPRLLIERMQLVAADLGVETEVTLGFDGDRWTGKADGAATPSSVHRAVAAATLRAVEQCVGGVMRLELEHLETPPMGNDRAVVVEISMITRRGAERLTGVSSIREDVRQAVIRATLDALNRRLESYFDSA